MTECSSNITLKDLPTCSSVDNQGYLIVQNTDNACKVKIADLVLGVGNVDFYPELLDIISQLETLTAIVQTKSAEWDTCYTTTNTNSAAWGQVDSLGLADVGFVVESLSAEWEGTRSLVFAKSALWDTEYTYMNEYAAEWDDGLATISLYPDYADTIGIVQGLSSEWNHAYNVTRSIPTEDIPDYVP